MEPDENAKYELVEMDDFVFVDTADYQMPYIEQALQMSHMIPSRRALYLSAYCGHCVFQYYSALYNYSVFVYNVAQYLK